MTRARGSGQAARLIALLAVALGLLAMHGLASTHHAAAATPITTLIRTDVPATGSPADIHAAHEDDHEPASAVAHRTNTPTGAGASQHAETQPAPAGGDCDLTCPTTVLCLAVLTAAIAAASAALVRRRSGTRTVARPRSHRPPGAARAAPRPPDPVAELCTSRT